MSMHNNLRLQDDQSPKEGTENIRRAQVDALLAAELQIRGLEVQLALAQRDRQQTEHENKLLSLTVDDLSAELEGAIIQDDQAMASAQETKIKELYRANEYLRGQVEALNDHIDETVKGFEEVIDDLEEESTAVRLSEKKLIAELTCWEKVATSLMTQVELQDQLTKQRDAAKRQSNELASRLTGELDWDECCCGKSD